MSCGNEYIPILPDFEIYCTCISHGYKPMQVSTKVLGIKSAPWDAKLLSNFFTHLALATSNDQHDSILGRIFTWPAHLWANYAREQFFLDYSGNNTSESGVQCLVYSHQSKSDIQIWTGLSSWPPYEETLVSLDQICCKKQVFNPHNKNQSTGSSRVDQHEFGSNDLEIDTTGYRSALFQPSVPTRQTNAFCN